MKISTVVGLVEPKDAKVFRYASPKWLRKHKFIVHRRFDRWGDTKNEFTVSEWQTGLAITLFGPTRNIAKKRAKTKLVENGQSKTAERIKMHPKVNQ